MDTLANLPPMLWIILASAILIMVLVSFAKAIKLLLKVAVIAVMLLFIAFFLREAGLLPF